MRTSPLLLLGLGVLLAAVGLDLRVALRGETEVLPATLLNQAAELARAEMKPGDLLVHSPLLSIRELAGLGALAAKPDLPAPELRKSRRVLVIDRLDQPMGGLGRPSEVKPIGGPLALFIYPPAGDASGLLFDLLTGFERAELRIERPAGTTSSHCRAPRGEGGFACPGEADWLYLSPRTLTIEGKPANCIWAHPTTGGVVVIELPATPAPSGNKKLFLELRAALTDDAASGTPDGAPVRTDIVQGGTSRGSVTVQNRPGWFKNKVEIAADQPIELRITTARDGRRHHCINAEISE